MTFWTQERADELLAMRAQGLTMQAMADALGVGRGAVSTKLARLEGRSVNYKPHTYTRKAKRKAERPAYQPNSPHSVFEPYAVFKARKQAERANGVR